jgi:hypothetical protein
VIVNMHGRTIIKIDIVCINVIAMENGFYVCSF